MQKSIAEYTIFWKRFLKHPKKLGSVLPSSKGLAALIGDFVCQTNNQFVLELGPGTGRFTDAILNAGVKHDCFACIEIDSYLCDFLRVQFPLLNIFQGNAQDLENLLPKDWIGKITTIVSGIPLMNLPKSIRKKIIDACFRVLDPQGKLLQFTYSPLPFVPPQGFHCKKIGVVWTNIPPAILWSFERIF